MFRAAPSPAIAEPSGASTTFEAFNWRTISGHRVTEVLRQVYGESLHKDIILLNYNQSLTFTKDGSPFNSEKVVNLIEQCSNVEHHCLMSELLQVCRSFLKQVIVATQVQAIFPAGSFYPQAASTRSCTRSLPTTRVDGRCTTCC